MILLDTHALLWWTGAEQSRLSSKAQETIESFKAPGTLLVSVITSWEIALLISKARLGLDPEITDWLNKLAKLSSVEFITIDNAIAVEANRLPDYPYRDPADRLIIATARILNIPIVTADAKIRDYPAVETIW